MKNASGIWQDFCLEEIGVDGDGDTVFKRTRMGTLAESLGLRTDAYGLGRSTPREHLIKLDNPNATASLKSREAVARFLHEFANAIEDGDA